MATDSLTGLVAGMPRVARHIPLRAVDALRFMPVGLAAQAALLSLIYLISSTLVDRLHVAVPSNLLALLVLLGLLSAGLVRPAHVEELATFLLRHLTFFFVPFTVSLLVADHASVAGYPSTLVGTARRG